MENIIAAMEQAYSDYRQELEAAGNKYKPADGLFGVGHSIKDDPCHERLDACIAALTKEAVETGIDSQQAAQAIRLIITQTSLYPYPVSGQWMLYATERHAMQLVPLLTTEDAIRLCREYEKRYKPWNRLPVQKELHRALKRQGTGAGR